MSHKSLKAEKKFPKSVVVTPVSLALSLSPTTRKDSDAESLRSSHHHHHHHHHHRKIGKELFKDFQRENKHSFWNKPLAESVCEVAFLGFLEPWVLLITGGEKQLECLREAYARRVLKPPKNFTIANLGDIPGIEMSPIQQHQFIPLTEVLCLIISEMNKRSLTATQDTIRDKLAECYSKMPVPNPEIIHKSLGHLITERKIENGSGGGYMIVGLDKLPPDSPSGDEAEVTTTKKSKPKTRQPSSSSPAPSDRTYLMYKDGALTKHSLPEAGLMVDKSTQTVRSRSDSSSPRPVSYPANMNTIYEKSNTIGTSSPSKQRNAQAVSQAGSLQRSNSLRERRSPAKQNNLDRTASMRVKANEMETGYFTSDSETKPSCFGKLLGKSAKKKALAQDGNTKHQMFSAQFPPSDIHDPFFSYAHWLGKSPQKVAINAVTADSGSKVVSGVSPVHVASPGKKDCKKTPPREGSHKTVNHYKVEHGRLTQTAKLLQQKYHDNAQESMPESEQEFLKPTTHLYDEGFRTKVVAEQTQPVKNSKKNDKLKHYFASIQGVTKPQPAIPFEGISTDDQNDSEMELQRRNEVAAEKRRQKLEQLKERRQARIYTAHRVLRETSEMIDPLDNPPSAVEHPGSSCTTNAKEGHPTNPSGKFAKEDMETPEPMRRQMKVAERCEMKLSSPQSPSSGSFPEVLKTPKSYGNGHNNQQPSNYNECSEQEQYYRDEEIDNYTRQERRKKSLAEADNMQDPMHSYKRDAGTAAPNPNVREGTRAVNARPTSQHLDYMNNEQRAPPPPPPIRFSSQLDRSPGHQPPVHSVHPSLILQSPTSSSLPNQNAGDYPANVPAVHQRVESLTGSTADSGFNSPRSSLAQSHNNNSPSNQPPYDLLHPRHNGTTGIPVLIKPIPRQSLDETVDNREFDNNHRMIKSTSNPTHLAANRSCSAEKRKFKSSDTVDANSEMSEKTIYGSMEHRSKLDRPKSFEVIGTV